MFAEKVVFENLANYSGKWSTSNYKALDTAL
jgi:hypothetical protein